MNPSEETRGECHCECHRAGRICKSRQTDANSGKVAVGLSVKNRISSPRTTSRRKRTKKDSRDSLPPSHFEPRVALRQNANHFKHFRSEIVAIGSGISTSQPIRQIFWFSRVDTHDCEVRIIQVTLSSDILSRPGRAVRKHLGDHSLPILRTLLVPPRQHSKNRSADPRTVLRSTHESAQWRTSNVSVGLRRRRWER